MKKTRWYFMTKCPELQPIPHFAEYMSYSVLPAQHVVDDAAKGKWIIGLGMR